MKAAGKDLECEVLNVESSGRDWSPVVGTLYGSGLVIGEYQIEYTNLGKKKKILGIILEKKKRKGKKTNFKLKDDGLKKLEGETKRSGKSDEITGSESTLDSVVYHR
jgi:hypothetical protein